MENTDQSIVTKGLFLEFIADPVRIGWEDHARLSQSIAEHPYCQLLHAFHSRSVSVRGLEENNHFRTALLFSDRPILKSILTTPDIFRRPVEDRIPVPAPNQDDAAELEGDLNGPQEAEISEATINQKTENMDADERTNDKADFANPDDMVNPWDESTLVNSETDYQTANSADTHTAYTDETDDVNAVAMEIPDNVAERNEEQKQSPDEFSEPDEISQMESNDSADEDQHELDHLILGGAVQNYILDEELPAKRETSGPSDNHAESRFGEHVTRYNDEKMPYSFLWWLDKTRRENTENYQPYAGNFRLDTSKNITRNSVDPLSSQIIENIFHLQSPVDQFENAPRTVPFQVKRKGDYILEKFIKEEPQIKPPDSQKLDTENKARKSSEDPNDLVSETLAHIYTDQMLYHKAIETYKKLSLKFPEKSAYFADQIIELEKKIN